MGPSGAAAESSSSSRDRQQPPPPDIEKSLAGSMWQLLQYHTSQLLFNQSRQRRYEATWATRTPAFTETWGNDNDNDDQPPHVLQLWQFRPCWSVQWLLRRYHIPYQVVNCPHAVMEATGSLPVLLAHHNGRPCLVHGHDGMTTTTTPLLDFVAQTHQLEMPDKAANENDELILHLLRHVLTPALQVCRYGDHVTWTQCEGPHYAFRWQGWSDRVYHGQQAPSASWTIPAAQQQARQAYDMIVNSRRAAVVTLDPTSRADLLLFEHVMQAAMNRHLAPVVVEQAILLQAAQDVLDQDYWKNVDDNLRVHFQNTFLAGTSKSILETARQVSAAALAAHVPRAQRPSRTTWERWRRGGSLFAKDQPMVRLAGRRRAGDNSDASTTTTTDPQAKARQQYQRDDDVWLGIVLLSTISAVALASAKVMSALQQQSVA